VFPTFGRNAPHRLRTERHSIGSANWPRRRGGVRWVGRSVGIIGSGTTGRTCSESVAVHDSETCPFLGRQPVADVSRVWPVPPHFGIYWDNSSHPEDGGSTYGVTQNKRFTRCRNPKDGRDLKEPLWKHANWQRTALDGVIGTAVMDPPRVQCPVVPQHTCM